MSTSGYLKPSKVLEDLALAPRNPGLSISPKDNWLLFSDEPSMPKVEILARREEKLAGLRLDPTIKTKSRLEFATGVVAQDLTTDERITVPLPEDTEGIRYIKWSSCGNKFAFIRKLSSAEKLELWYAEFNPTQRSWATKPLVTDREINAISGAVYLWVPGMDKLLVYVSPIDHGTEPSQTIFSPTVQEVLADAKKAPGRTYQDLLKTPFDETKLKYFTTVEILEVDLSKNESRILPQSLNGKMIRSLSVSPDGKYSLVQYTSDPPFSYNVPLAKFAKKIEVWNLTNNEIYSITETPHNEEQPIAFDSSPPFPRSFHFHPCLENTLLFAECLDGGDPANEPDEDGCRDAIYTLSFPFDLQDRKLYSKMEWRFDDLDFTENGIGFLSEYRWKDRRQKFWILEEGKEKRLLFEKFWQDRYNDPGSFMGRIGSKGKYFIIMDKSPDGKRSIFLESAGANPKGDRPFVDKMDIDTFEKVRMWRCCAGKHDDGFVEDPKFEVDGIIPTDDMRKNQYESVSMILGENRDKLLISRESQYDPPNYFIVDFGKGTATEKQVTFFPHPQPALIGVKKELVNYEREDGVKLTANLYLPADYKEGIDGPLPCLMWAYPREFKNASHAGQVKSSPYRFVRTYWASPVFWVAKGFAIMDDFALPIIGEDCVEPNDTFVEQLTQGAAAAVEYVIKRGVSEKGRIAVGGHSYGAFMTANLLSHTDLFARGIARSGAYNRTLTPFSFQCEERSFWECPETYIEMSPFTHAKKFSENPSKPKILLIHGKEDENSGTHPLQSERYFAALKGFGAECKLVLLPLERHSYRGEQSILHMLAEQEMWLSNL